MRRNRILFAFAATLALTSHANAQCGNCVSTGATYLTSNICCNTISITPSEETLAAWAARKAVAAQLTWFDADKLKNMSREDIDKQQQRIDEILKWAKTLSNHIFATAYGTWGAAATSKIEDRRRDLDKFDVAKSIVTGLPTPPEMK